MNLILIGFTVTSNLFSLFFHLLSSVIEMNKDDGVEEEDDDDDDVTMSYDEASLDSPRGISSKVATTGLEGGSGSEDHSSSSWSDSNVSDLTMRAEEMIK